MKNQSEIQLMINRLLLPAVVTTPGGGWFGGTSEDEMLAFQAGGRSDNSMVEVTVDYGDIPIDLRRGIAIDLERELGRKPSEDEVVQKYEDVALAGEKMRPGHLGFPNLS